MQVHLKRNVFTYRFGGRTATSVQLPKAYYSIETENTSSFSGHYNTIRKDFEKICTRQSNYLIVRTKNQGFIQVLSDSTGLIVLCTTPDHFLLCKFNILARCSACGRIKSRICDILTDFVSYASLIILAINLHTTRLRLISLNVLNQ
jgi:hypothetical protein